MNVCLPPLLHSRTPYPVHPRSASLAFCVFMVCKAFFQGVVTLWLRFPCKAIRSTTIPSAAAELQGGGQPGWLRNLSSLEEMGPSQGKAHTVPRNRREKHLQQTTAERTPLNLVSAHVVATMAQEMHTQQTG